MFICPEHYTTPVWLLPWNLRILRILSSLAPCYPANPPGDEPLGKKHLRLDAITWQLDIIFEYIWFLRVMVLENGTAIKKFVGLRSGVYSYSSNRIFQYPLTYSRILCRNGSLEDG